MTSTTKVANRARGRTDTTPPALIKITLGVVVAIMLAMVMCSQADSGTTGGESPAAALPEGFPVPGGAALLPDGADPKGVVTFTAPGNAEDVVAFYGAELPKDGWSVEEWSGTDPFGDASQGYIITRDDEAGALSVKDTEQGARVEVNMNQPVSPSEGGMEMEMEMGGAGAGDGAKNGKSGKDN